MKSLLTLTATLLMSAAFAFAQQQQAGPQRYAQALYLKVSSANVQAMTDFYRTGDGAKAIEARLKDDPDLLGWSLRGALYQGENATGPNYVIVSIHNGPPKEIDSARRDAFFKSAVGMNYAQYIAKVRALSDLVGTSLAHVHHLTEGYTLAQGDVMVATRIKVAQGKTQEHSALVREVQFPLAAERVKSGGRLKGWAFSHFVFPSGSSLEYEATQTSVYKTLADSVGGPGTGGAGAAMARFTKAFPNRNYVAYMDDLRSMAKVVRVDVYRVIASASR